MIQARVVVKPTENKRWWQGGWTWAAEKSFGYGEWELEATGRADSWLAGFQKGIKAVIPAHTRCDHYELLALTPDYPPGTETNPPPPSPLPAKFLGGADAR